MKNEAEEKAIAFVRELQKEELTNSNHSGFYILPQLLGVAHKSFMVGYNEAIRWRDPKIELPEEGVDVFVKMIRSGEYGEETIYTSSHVVNNFYHDSESNPFGCEGYYAAGNGGRVRVTVIGWRPIENKNHFEGRIEEAGCDFCRDEQGYTIGNMYVCDKCGRQVP